MKQYFTAFLFTGVTLFTPADAYIKTREAITSPLWVTNTAEGTSFEIQYPHHGTLDQFLNTVNKQRPLTPLLDPHEFKIIAQGMTLKTEQLSQLHTFTTILIAVTENRKYAPLKMDLVTRLFNDRSSLIKGLKAKT